MNEDMSEFLGVFLDEANEQVQLLEGDILKLEQSSSSELLQEIFRAAHTLKGSSRAMGFVSMGELTHAMEDVFDQLRQDKLIVNRKMIDALFAGLDSLKAMMKDIAGVSSTERDTTQETASLRAVLAGQEVSKGAAVTTDKQTSKKATKPKSETSEKQQQTESGVASPSALSPDVVGIFGVASQDVFHTKLSASVKVAMQEAHSVGCSIYGLKIEVSPDCVMKSVRALMTMQALERVSSTLASWPDEDGLENEDFDTMFEIVLASEATPDAIVAAVHSVNEVHCALIAPWDVDTQQQSLQNRDTLENDTEDGTQAEQQTEKHSIETSLEDTKEVAKTPSDPALPAKAEAAKARVQNATVRVDVTRLDKLLNLVGELVIDRTRIARLSQRFEQEYASNPLLDSLNETSVHIGRIMDELQDEIMKARMLPLESVFSRFPRMIRDLAQKLNKEVQFVVEGQETELDRTVIEVIGDPLIHMLRNSIDHGIETPDTREKAGKPRAGTVWLQARHQENSIVIEIQDDGAGIAPDKLRAGAIKKGVLTEEAAQRMSNREAMHLIFAPGFSTAETLTDVSGCGVGMDIVRSNLQRLGALIDIDSKVGIGTTFRVQLPLTLAIIRGLLVSVDACVYALPLNAVVETLQIEPGDIHTINHREVIWQRDRTLPLVRLHDIFPVHTLGRQQERGSDFTSDSELRGAGSRNRRKAMYVVVAGVAEKQVGFVVDALVGEQEVVIKTLGKFIGEIQGIAGTTILGDGRVALIADINGLTAIAAEEKGKAHAA